MDYVWVSRFVKKDQDTDSLREVVQANRKHWENVALDLGFDPSVNVTVRDGEKEIRLGISEEMDATLREEPGDWW
jgi:hypothetical protein